MPKWNEQVGNVKAAVKLIAASLEKAKKVNDGKCAFTAFPEFHENMVVLGGAVKFSKDVPESEYGRLVWKAVSAAGNNGTITSDSLLRELRNVESDYLRQPKTPFTLITSLSLPIRLAAKIEDISILGAVVSFKNSSSVVFSPNQDLERTIAEIFKGRELPKHYAHVYVTVDARTAEAAANLALDALTLLRGIWNFSLNIREGMRMTFGGPQRPVNAILSYPIQTVRSHAGELASKLWYDLEYLGPSRIPDSRINKAWSDLREHEAWFLHRLSKHKFRDELVTAYQRYNKALDDPDYDAAIMKLWSVLELVTGRGTYEQAVKRTAFTYADAEQVEMELNYLCHRRNQLVHHMAGEKSAEEALYMLKGHVEGMLDFQTRNWLRFESMGASGEFLDLSRDANHLKRRQQMAKFGRWYRRDPKVRRAERKVK